MNLSQNSRWKIQTADGNYLSFQLAIKPYLTSLHRQMEIYSQNPFPSGNCKVTSNQYQSQISPDGNGVNKTSKNPRRKIHFNPYSLWHQSYFPDGTPSPYYFVIGVTKVTPLLVSRIARNFINQLKKL